VKLCFRKIEFSRVLYFIQNVNANTVSCFLSGYRKESIEFLKKLADNLEEIEILSYEGNPEIAPVVRDLLCRKCCKLTFDGNPYVVLSNCG
ncbi:hypothetical protein PENTCL1PPCAC_1514, partial [Pristionchus entomophagus]